MTAEQGNEQVRKQLWKPVVKLWLRIQGSVWDQIKHQTEYPARGQVEIQIWADHPASIAVQAAAVETVRGAKEDNDGQ